MGPCSLQCGLRDDIETGRRGRLKRRVATMKRLCMPIILATAGIIVASVLALVGCGAGETARMGSTAKVTTMNERHGLVTFKGKPLTLLGSEVAVGQPAPDFAVLAIDLSEVRLSDFRGRIVLIAAVPSLDTPVCDIEARRFNTEAAKLGDAVKVLVVSMDLPFAQRRWCGAAGVDNAQTVSDHRDAAFGTAYGVLIKELRLLARSIWVVDQQGEVRYVELVTEMTDEPDYDAALTAASQLIGK